MVKTPRTKHSKSTRQPVTIELEAKEEKPQTEAEAGAAETEAVNNDETTNEIGGGTTDGPVAGPDEPEDSAQDDKQAVEDRPGDQNIPHQKKQGTSFPKLITAGVIGAVLAIGGNAVLTTSGLIPGGQQQESAGIETLRSDIDELKNNLQARVDAANGSARSAAEEAVSAAVANTDSRIASLSEEIVALESGLQQVKSALETGEGGSNAALQALKDRLDDIEAKIGALADSPAEDGADAQALASIQSDLERLQTAASGAADVTKANAASIDALKSELAALAQRVEQQGSNPQVALAIAAAALKSAIDRGQPFMTELETYAAVAPDAPAIGALRDLAASGVPTRADIASGMGDAANAMLAAVSTVEEDAGFIDRLMSSAQSAIKVRPVGMVEGDAPGAIIARMEVAVNGNDYKKALAEYETLPDNAKTAGAAFVARINARMKVDALIDTALAAALKAG